MRSYRVAATRWRQGLTAIGMVFLFAMLAGCGKGAGDAAAKEQADPAATAVPVETAEASRRAIAASYTGTAPLEAQAEAQVVAKTSGVALQVLVEEGDVVRAGQPLVRLDPDRARLNLAQLQAQLSKLESNFNRSDRLASQQLISAGDHEQLKYDLENVRAAYRLAQLELSYTNVVAPIPGVVASRSIKTGNFVQINTPILRIIDNSRLEATLNVPERELATLRAGLPVRLQVDALPGREFTGTVDRVAPVVDAGSGTFRVICAFAGDDLQPGALQPGMFGRIRIDYDQRADALTIPRLALLDDEGDPSVYVVREGKAVRTPIELGYVDGNFVEVRKGLEPGDAVVTAGKVALRDGGLVQVIGPRVAAASTAAPDDSSGERQ